MTELMSNCDHLVNYVQSNVLSSEVTRLCHTTSRNYLVQSTYLLLDLLSSNHQV